MLLLLV